MSSLKRRHQPRVPLTVYGGLRLQGANRDVWWRKAWIAWLETLNMGARLGRGRNYAQAGQVRSLNVSEGVLEARVQGVEVEAYHVAISMESLPREIVNPILASDLLLMAQLAVNALPIRFDQALRTQGVSLFPVGREQVVFRCSCKDWARPCKHIAAALCLFADAIASEPTLLLRFRGVEIAEVLPVCAPQVLSAQTLSTLPLSHDPLAVPRRLGTLPYWRGNEDLRKTLEGSYRRAAERALVALDTAAAELRTPADYGVWD